MRSRSTTSRCQSWSLSTTGWGRGCPSLWWAPTSPSLTQTPGTGTEAESIPGAASTSRIRWVRLNLFWLYLFRGNCSLKFFAFACKISLTNSTELKMLSWKITDICNMFHYQSNCGQDYGVKKQFDIEILIHNLFTPGWHIFNSMKPLIDLG